VPEVTKTRFAGRVSNRAVVEEAPLMVNGQKRYGSLPAQAPVHPVSTDETVAPLLVGLAVKVTLVLLANVAAQGVGAVQVVLPG
jgi:hypothetical protein